MPLSCNEIEHRAIAFAKDWACARAGVALVSGTTGIEADASSKPYEFGDTLNLDEQLIEAAITPRTKVILPVHLYGQPADMDPILAIARQFDFAVVAEGVETRIFSAGNLGLHPFWMNRYGKASFPVADRVHHCGFFLPNHASMTDQDVLHISRIVLEAA